MSLMTDILRELIIIPDVAFILVVVMFCIGCTCCALSYINVMYIRFT